MKALPIVLLCAAASVASADPKVVEKSRLEVQPASKAFKELRIENPLGNVRIEGHDGKSIMIETHKTAPDDETLERLRVSLVPDADGTVRIATTADAKGEAKSQKKATVSIDLIIRAPRDARIDATLGSGKLEVVNMDAGGELDTASGSITVKNISGDLYTHSVSGHMSIVQAFGPVDAATISSDLELDTIGGERLIASANQGKIAGRRVRARDVELTTMKGNIQLEAETSMRGRVVVSSMHGNVDVKIRRNGALVARGFGTKVDLGAMAKAQADGWMQAVIGQGEDPAIVLLRSTHGIVRLTYVQ